MKKPQIVRAPAGSISARQAASQNSTGARKERNKYAAQQLERTANRAAERAEWNAKIDATLNERRGSLWRWQMNTEQNGMQLVDRKGRLHDMGWYQHETLGSYVGCRTVSYPILLATAEFKEERAERIVNRIVAYLNKEQ